MGCSLNTYWRDVGRQMGTARQHRGNAGRSLTQGCRNRGKMAGYQNPGSQGRASELSCRSLRRGPHSLLLVSLRGCTQAGPEVQNHEPHNWRQQPTSAAGVKAITRRLAGRKTASKRRSKPSPTPNQPSTLEEFELTLAEPTGSPWEEKCVC